MIRSTRSLLVSVALCAALTVTGCGKGRQVVTPTAPPTGRNTASAAEVKVVVGGKEWVPATAVKPHVHDGMIYVPVLAFAQEVAPKAKIEVTASSVKVDGRTLEFAEKTKVHEHEGIVFSPGVELCLALGGRGCAWDAGTGTFTLSKAAG